MNPICIIDLFAGPGGLGEGFSSVLKDGTRPFRIAVSVEKDEHAHKTLSLRAFFRWFLHEGKRVPADYYKYLAGEMALDELFSKYPDAHNAVKKEALCAELGNSDYQLAIDTAIASAVNGRNDWLLIGGPPCQAYSLVGRARMQNAADYRRIRGHSFDKDHRHKLYREYLRIIAKHAPSVFVMENVKGILSSKLAGEKVFPQILNDLRDPSNAAIEYGWEDVLDVKYRVVSFVTGEEPGIGDERDFLIQAEDYGIPQARHRVILLGIREDVYESIAGKVPPLKTAPDTPLKKVIHPLPKLRSGFSKSEDSSEHWNEYFQTLENAPWLKSVDPKVKGQIDKALVALKKSRRRREYNGAKPYALGLFEGWYNDPRLKGLANHTTRAHMDKDLDRYLFVSAYGKAHKASPRLKDFPKQLLPKHENVQDGIKNGKFADRFKVQLEGSPASTITSHISKDGHYFIHPDPSQCRSLTVREAARIQTFPDNYFFEGGRTQQYHQVGNAVPPYLAKQLAEVVYEIFTGQ